MTAAAIAALHPAYFALAMATGIVSIAAHLLGLPAIARALFWLNCGVYGVLWVLYVVRLVRHRAAVVADFLHHGRCVGYFTIVAATSSTFGHLSKFAFGMPLRLAGVSMIDGATALTRMPSLATSSASAIDSVATPDLAIV